jgi:soluble lytic murein transglycosylase
MMRLQDYDGAIVTLARLSRESPESGLHDRVRWELALASLMAGRPDQALPYLDEELGRLDAGRGVLFGAAEKLRYFRGVALRALGRGDEALADLERVAASFPHSYYSVLATARLVEWAGRTVAPPQPDDGAGAPGPRSVTVCDHARGPIALWQLGYAAEGLETLKARARLGLLDRDGVTALAALLASGRPPRVAMWSREYLRGLPGDGTRDLFETAYPRPFPGEVRDAAVATGADPALVWAVMRVESGFEPSAKSPVGAVGLMQVMPSSARMIASRILEDPKAAKGLWRPGRNVLLGAAFLAELDRHFRGHLPLVLAAYNAGPGAAHRFYKRLKDFPTDLFVEAVPYGVTSAYIKKVIGLAAAYRHLYDDAGRGPLLVQPGLPETFGPFLEKRSRGPMARGYLPPFEPFFRAFDGWDAGAASTGSTPYSSVAGTLRNIAYAAIASPSATCPSATRCASLRPQNR